MMDMANLDRVFDALVPDSVKNLLSSGMQDLKKVDDKLLEIEANK
jgi:hypothetical protein